MTPFERAMHEATGDRRHLLMTIWANRIFLIEAKRLNSPDYVERCREAIRITAQQWRVQL